jgi:hypothetical protein
MKPVYTRGGVVAICITTILLGFIVGLTSAGMPITSDVSWFQLSALALGSAFAVKIADIFYQEIRRRLDRTHAATAFVDEHLDPVLKAADEVVGKLHSLAVEDFKSIAGKDLSLNPVTDNDFGGLLYLFGRFWARVEIFKIESLSVAIARDGRGASLQSFLACLESTKVRIVDRTAQRAIGEVFIKPAPEAGKTIGYVEFIRSIETSEETRRWIEPLASVLRRTHHTDDRQRLLQYGAVVHALVDSLDPMHLVTSSRPSYPNKLTERTRKALRYRVFGVYLKSVPNNAKYTTVQSRGFSKKG